MKEIKESSTVQWCNKQHLPTDSSELYLRHDFISSYTLLPPYKSPTLIA